jgi:UDP-N-acetylmuramate: L-alanyl-gamma-D-glutamyl-meso-diaminopimelate ligase
VVNGEDARLAEVLGMGCWTPVETFGLDPAHAVDGRAFDWTARMIVADGSAFAVVHGGRELGEVRWPLLGRHNVMNALAALAAVHAVGVEPRKVIPSLLRFRSVKRRMEVVGIVGDLAVYDDFAHHPTAIETTLEGLRSKVGDARIAVAMEPRSNSMRLGAHADALAPSLAQADIVVFLHRPELAWDATKVVGAIRGDALAVPDVDTLLTELRNRVHPGDHVVFMSNGGFDGAPRRFVEMLEAKGVIPAGG